MAEITQTEKNDFIQKVMKATDDVSHAKLIEEIKGLITRKPNLLKSRSFGMNCFHCIKSVELAEFIYKRDPSLINERKGYGRLPIHSAAYNGRLPIVEFLVEKDPTMLHATTTHARMTPLLHACYDSHLDVVQWILEHELSTLNHVDAHGRTALNCIAVYGSHHPNALLCAKLLLKVNAEMRGVENNDGETPVMIARKQDSSSELTLFLEKLEKHDESIADSKSFLPTVKAMLLAMEADNQAVAPLCDSMVTKTRKTAMDAVVVVAEWTESIAVNAKSDIVKLVQS